MIKWIVKHNLMLAWLVCVLVGICLPFVAQVMSKTAITVGQAVSFTWLCIGIATIYTMILKVVERLRKVKKIEG